MMGTNYLNYNKLFPARPWHSWGVWTAFSHQWYVGMVKNRCPQKTNIILFHQQTSNKNHKLCFFAGKMNGGCLRALDLTNGGRSNPSPRGPQTHPIHSSQINKLINMISSFEIFSLTLTSPKDR